MKKLYLLVLCMISAMLVNAQAPVWNVKVGLGASSWMGDGFGSAKALFNQRIRCRCRYPSYRLGVFFRLVLTGLPKVQNIHW